MAARKPGLILGKGVLLAIPFGLWGFGYHWLALGACLECSVLAGLIYAVVAVIGVPLAVLSLLKSSWGQLRIYLRWFHRPNAARVLVTGVVWGLAMGLTVFGATGSARRIAPVLVAWVVFWVTFAWLFSVLFGRNLGFR
ncbi:MAG TPA: hypothetical protein VHI54_04100 [Actinomycetota bacterium]|nr:hypothetical protein [Actinomycetota bacterium]